MMGRVLLTSFGLATKAGFELYRQELLKDGDLSDKVIYLFYEPYDSLHEMFQRSCQMLGFQPGNVLHSQKDEWPEGRYVDYMFVGEGNTFESMRLLRNKGLFERIRKACTEDGAAYLGASAGAVIAGKNVSCARCFDKEEAHLEDWEKEGLGLVDGIVFPHVKDLDELSGIDLAELLRTEGGETLTPYAVANDGILTFEGRTP